MSIKHVECDLILTPSETGRVHRVHTTDGMYVGRILGKTTFSGINARGVAFTSANTLGEATDKLLAGKA